VPPATEPAAEAAARANAPADTGFSFSDQSRVEPLRKFANVSPNRRARLRTPDCIILRPTLPRSAAPQRLTGSSCLLLSQVAYIALGSNVGDRVGNIERALRRLCADGQVLPRSRVCARFADAACLALSEPRGKGQRLTAAKR
jgi:hypothetical protein